MSEHSRIEWTDATWNPVRGCTKISAGCRNCYAAAFAERFRGVVGHPYEQGFDLRLVPEKLSDPIRWKHPSRIFVNSMSDLFHEDVPEEFIARAFEVMRAGSWHVFQVLTKRSARMREIWTSLASEHGIQSHVWAGVTVEDRVSGLPRIDDLRRIPAAVRFLSVEPLLEDLGRIDLSGIHWVIVGGESGPLSRPMEEDWVLSIRDQCRKAGAAFFFKQWGGVRKAKAGRTLSGRTYDDQPRVRTSPMPAPEERHRILGEIECAMQA